MTLPHFREDKNKNIWIPAPSTSLGTSFAGMTEGNRQKAEDREFLIDFIAPDD